MKLHAVSGSKLSLASLRSRILQRIFKLLYGPLVLLHEPAGRVIFGQAWPVRRTRLLDLTGPAEVTLDLGCGTGLLLDQILVTNHFAFGIDPSTKMLKRARRRCDFLACGMAQSLPIRSNSVDRVVVSYPGPWICDHRTWSELHRITKSGAELAILLGGSYDSGVASRLRRTALAIAYGRSSRADLEQLTSEFGGAGISGRLHVVHDRWGRAYYWMGTRL